MNNMVGNYILLFLLVTNNPVSAWVTWYSSTHHDTNTTPGAGAGDSNEINHQTEDTTSIPGKFPNLHEICLIAQCSTMIVDVTIYMVTVNFYL